MSRMDGTKRVGKGLLPLESFIKLVILVVVALIIIVMIRKFGSEVSGKSESAFKSMTDLLKTRWGVSIK